MAKKEFPSIHFYDQDFVDIYDQTWAWMEDYMQSRGDSSALQARFFNDPNAVSIEQVPSCFSTFFMVYSNKKFSAAPQLDNFYGKQEEDGAIRWAYDVQTGLPLLGPENPEGVGLPLFSWVEYNLYHKIGNKKRVKEVMPNLERYFSWLEATFKDSTGMYVVPLAATGMPSDSRLNGKYFLDFNTVMAINALYMSELGEILNDKDISFKYKKHYFSLKTKISQLMWDESTGMYHDLDENQKRLPAKTLATFWALLAEIPNEEKAEKLQALLSDPQHFGTPHPFPTVAASEETFSENGNGYNGSVLPHLTFMVIKGLEKLGAYEQARDYSIRHLYYMLDTLHPEHNKRGNVWEAYRPTKDGAAEWEGHPEFPRPLYLPYVGLSTVALMIENIIGLYISLPKKTVDWKVPTIEAMGIENLSLKRNMVTILSNKTNRGWEIRLESEKLYYFTIDILSLKKKKTLPIPSGKCSMLIDKL